LFDAIQLHYIHRNISGESFHTLNPPVRRCCGSEHCAPFGNPLNICDSLLSISGCLIPSSCRIFMKIFPVLSHRTDCPFKISCGSEHCAPFGNALNICNSLSTASGCLIPSSCSIFMKILPEGAVIHRNSFTRNHAVLTTVTHLVTFSISLLQPVLSHHVCWIAHRCQTA